MPSYKLLLLTPFLEIREGVSNFCRMLLNNLCSDFHADYLQIGNRPGNRSFVMRFFYLVQSGYELTSRLRNSRHDVIQINPSFSKYCLLRDSLYLLIIASFGYARKTIVFFHGWNLHLGEKIANSRILRSLFTKIYNRVAIILVLHRRCKQQLLDIGISSEKIKITTTMYETISGIDQGRLLKINEKVNLVFMSRFVNGKGVDIAAKAIKLLVENGHKDFHSLFAGDGPLMSDLKDFITENKLSDYIRVLGYIDGIDKAEVMRKGDIFILPTSLQEGCPLVIMEAMGAGHAIVSTARGAIPEVIEDGKNGFVCDSIDPMVFYEAVKKLLDNRELLNNMKKANRKKAEKNYEARVYMRNMESIYLSVIKGNKVT